MSTFLVTWFLWFKSDICCFQYCTYRNYFAFELESLKCKVCNKYFFMSKEMRVHGSEKRPNMDIQSSRGVLTAHQASIFVQKHHHWSYSQEIRVKDMTSLERVTLMMYAGKSLNHNNVNASLFLESLSVNIRVTIHEVYITRKFWS